MRISATVVEKREAEHRIFGWAVLSQKRDGSDLIDLQGDHVALPDLEAAVYEAMADGLNGGEMHQGDAEARIIESMVWTPEKAARLGIPEGVLPTGWWIGQQVGEETFQRVRVGDRLWFSIEGLGERQALDTPEIAKQERPKGECRWRTIGGRPVCITTGHAHGEAPPSPAPMDDEKRKFMLGKYLTELDARESKAEIKRYGRANQYRLGHYLQAAERVRERVTGGEDFARAFASEFTPGRGTHWLARKLGLPLEVEYGEWRG
jgi:Putative phage serine protease XkdF